MHSHFMFCDKFLHSSLFSYHEPMKESVEDNRPVIKVFPLKNVFSTPPDLSCNYKKKTNQLLTRLDECDKGSLEKLQQQLQKKDSQLTESRLEALSSAHQLHTLRETVVSLRQEMTRLKVENEKIYQTKTKTPEISHRKNYKVETLKGPISVVSNK